MIKLWRIAAYTFLALTGMYAWLSTQAGWRQWVGLAIFLIATLRILVMLLPKKKKAGQSQPPESTSENPD